MTRSLLFVFSVLFAAPAIPEQLVVVDTVSAHRGSSRIAKTEEHFFGGCDAECGGRVIGTLASYIVGRAQR